MRLSKLSFAPLPAYREITKIFKAINKTDHQFKESLSIDNSKTFWFSRSAWALYTIVKFRMQAFSNRSINIWIPDYFCNSSLLPVRSLGANIYFYPILNDRKPDLNECKNMLKNNSPDIILFVDYFGETLFSEGLFDLARINNAWLIKDSAHCLKPLSQVKDADFVLYSPHKLLPIPDGGLLIIQKNGPNNFSNEMLIKFDFNSIYFSVINQDKFYNLQEYKWLLKRLLQKLGLPLKSPKVRFNTQESLLNIKQFSHPVMSEMAKKILFLTRVDFNRESQIRKTNYDEWRKLLMNNAFLKTVIEIPPVNHVPYLAEIKVIDITQVEKIFDIFKKAQIPISTWPDLAPEVLKEPVKHNVAIKMRLSRIFLPVHSSINPYLIGLTLKNLRIKGD